MKVRKKGCNRYIKMQEGGLGAFRGTSRYKRGGGGMFGMLAKSVRSMLPKFQMWHEAVTSSFKLCRLG